MILFITTAVKTSSYIVIGLIKVFQDKIQQGRCKRENPPPPAIETAQLFQNFAKINRVEETETKIWCEPVTLIAVSLPASNYQRL
jgi:hypothetical protein